MKNSKSLSLLGFLFALVLITSTVTAEKEENKAVEATKETADVPSDAGKQDYGGGGSGEGGYGGGGGGGGGCGCCYIHGYKYCGRRCCWPQNEEPEAVTETDADVVNPEGYGYGGGGWGGRGWGGGGWGGRGWGGRGGGWGGRGGGWGGRGGGWGGRGWGGRGGGWGGRGWGGGGGYGGGGGGWAGDRT